MSRTWILTASGGDRPGIVAGVTKVLFSLGCNLEDSAMTRLEGEFAIMLVFSAPSRATEEKLEHALDVVGRRLRLAVHLKPLKSSRSSSRRGPSHVISVYGADRPGIVYRVSELLATLRVNITDVSTHRTLPSAAVKPLYLLLLEVELPSRLSADRLERRLRGLAKRLGVEVSLRSAETSIL